MLLSLNGEKTSGVLERGSVRDTLLTPSPHCPTFPPQTSLVTQSLKSLPRGRTLKWKWSGVLPGAKRKILPGWKSNRRWGLCAGKDVGRLAGQVAEALDQGWVQVTVMQ